MAHKLPFTLLLLVLGLVFLVSVLADNEGLSPEDIAAEEAAAAAVGEQAGLDADDDISDALDEDVDAARATIEDPTKHPLSNMPPPSDDVDVSTVIKGLNDDGILPVGQDYSALVAFGNSGRTSFHVWGVMGSLNYDDDWKVYVQNFTYQVVNRTVESGQELSLNYRFLPNDRLDTRDFRMALSLFYEARNTGGEAVRSHSSTFFNQTVKAVAGPAKVSASYAAFIVSLLAALGAGGFYGYKAFSDADKPSIDTTTTEGQGSKDDWLAEHHNMIGSRTRARSTSPGRSGSKNR